MSDTRALWETTYSTIVSAAQARGEANAVYSELPAAYRSFSRSQQAEIDLVLTEWLDAVESFDYSDANRNVSTKAFDAIHLADVEAIEAAVPALERLAERLRASDYSMAPHHVKMIEESLDRIAQKTSATH